MIIPEKARCVRCSTLFEVGQAIDQPHHILHCNRCGREKILKIEEFSKFFSLANNGIISRSPSPSFDKHSQTRSKAHGTLINDRKYRFMVEYRAGLCICGSMFKFPGKARCPQCRSSVYQIEPSYFVTELVTH
jgi:Zn finger protein HypA/HybF involved in hydrogenase expression